MTDINTKNDEHLVAIAGGESTSTTIGEHSAHATSSGTRCFAYASTGPSASAMVIASGCNNRIEINAVSYPEKVALNKSKEPTDQKFYEQLPRDGEPRDSEPRDGKPRDTEPRDGEPRDSKSRDKESRDKEPRDTDENYMEPRDTDENYMEQSNKILPEQEPSDKDSLNNEQDSTAAQHEKLDTNTDCVTISKEKPTTFLQKCLQMVCVSKRAPSITGRDSPEQTDSCSIKDNNDCNHGATGSEPCSEKTNGQGPVITGQVSKDLKPNKKCNCIEHLEKKSRKCNVVCACIVLFFSVCAMLLLELRQRMVDMITANSFYNNNYYSQ